ncbi:hypothetical protein [Candidatus Borrarchaeum sp.]|uniref:hypothetical protein n=1 Tax=Candidatus Borrarchaeum sp. TaxID=2846742 RepID=UPI002579BFF9|nr:hypothetical protein [Candidatus Borrarchaeum sp.]
MVSEVILSFVGTDFIEGNSSDSPITLLIDESNKKLVLQVSPQSGFVERRTAERQARGIAKIGFALKNGNRVGHGFDLDVAAEGGGVPERLHKEVWNNYSRGI